MKKIRINLYGPEFRPKKVILSLGHMLIIWALSALIVGITYFITYQEKVNLEKEIGKLTREVDDLNNQ